VLFEASAADGFAPGHAGWKAGMAG